jgi:cation diffusion facilitator CzcD-associated flavoprotein CzcO
MRACIIGAGSSGIAAAKALHARGIDFVCYEKSDRVGGNWVFGNKNGMSSAYRGLYINTSRDRMQYSDFPMPKSYPDFPHHTQIAAYFDEYVDHFGFRSKIRFDAGVKRAALTGKRWDIELEGGTRESFDALLVANGHHWDARWPEPRFPGTFSGREMHSHEYKDVKELTGKRVVVLGMGNSAMDIAVESSYEAERTVLCARRGAWVVPKYLFGKPLDQLTTRAGVPFRVRQAMLEGVYKLWVGEMERYGLPRPDHRLGEAHPTISGRILDRLTHGAITVKPNIASLEGDSVRFVDGTTEKADVVIYCTGYKVTFPFFDPSFLSAPDNDLPLFRRVFHPTIPNVFFIGLLQPLGAIMPLAEAQGIWIAKYLLGEYALPSRGEMKKDIDHERKVMFKRYVASKRHTMQVDYDDYLADLHKEIARGAKRAHVADIS